MWLCKLAYTELTCSETCRKIEGCPSTPMGTGRECYLLGFVLTDSDSVHMGENSGGTHGRLLQGASGLDRAHGNLSDQKQKIPASGRHDWTNPRDRSSLLGMQVTAT